MQGQTNSLSSKVRGLVTNPDDKHMLFSGAGLVESAAEKAKTAHHSRLQHQLALGNPPEPKVRFSLTPLISSGSQDKMQQAG